MTATTPLMLADIMVFTEIALVIFLVIFVGIVVWVFVLRRKSYRTESRIPLEEDRVMTPRDDRSGDDDEATNTGHSR